jgi:hypothetical protein
MSRPRRFDWHRVIFATIILWVVFAILAYMYIAKVRRDALEGIGRANPDNARNLEREKREKEEVDASPPDPQ